MVSPLFSSHFHGEKTKQNRNTSMNKAGLGENKALILHTALSAAEDSDQ